MQKEFEKHQKMEAMDETQKKEFEETLKKEEEAKKHHQPVVYFSGSSIAKYQKYILKSFN